MDFLNAHLSRCEALRAASSQGDPVQADPVQADPVQIDAMRDLVQQMRAHLAGIEDAKAQRAALTELARQERRPFATDAAAAIDRALPAAEEGPASALKANKSLLNFVSLVSPNIRLRARAGAGKSTAIVIKCDFLINALGVPPERIQVLTFNKKAAQSLSARLCERLGAALGGRVGVNTFHSLAFHVLKRSAETADWRLNFEADDAALSDQQNKVPFLLRQAIKAQTSARDLRTYERAFDGTRHAYMVDTGDFAEALNGFISDAAALLQSRRGTPGGVRQTPVIQHLERVVSDYETRLADKQILDGQTGLRKAAEILSGAQPLSGFKRLNGALQYLFVDEYQDFSAAFEGLVQGVMARNPACVLNVVGDDWQSINGFMGAEPVYFETFRRRYPAALHLPLQVNWRCGRRIVAFGNDIMQADSREAAEAGLAHAGSLRLGQGRIVADKYRKAAWQEEACAYLEGALEKMARAAFAEDAAAGRGPGSLVLLAAKKRPFGRGLERFAAELSAVVGQPVATSTCHSAKGLQWDHVIVLDGVADAYPAAHPADPVQSALMPAREKEAESHRLLYVAATRARLSLAVLAPTELHPRLRSLRQLTRPVK